MTDLEFVLSLTPKQIYKFVDFNKKFDATRQQSFVANTPEFRRYVA